MDKSIARENPPVEHIAVVPTALFQECGYFQGFNGDVSKYAPLFDPKNVQYKPKAEMEHDPSFKQLIPYVILAKMLGAGDVAHAVHMSYSRGAGQDEKRLVGKSSIGIGGHVNDRDVGIAGDPFGAGMMREVFEEVHLQPVVDALSQWDQEIQVPKYSIQRFGLINDDTTDVGTVHLGIAHVMWVDGFKITAAEPDICDLRWWDVRTLEKESEAYEPWSQICIAHLVSEAG